MTAPKQRSFPTPLEWMRPRLDPTAWTPWRLPVSLVRRTRYVLLLLAFAAGLAVAPFVLRDLATPGWLRIVALAGLATLLVAWTVAYRTGRHATASLLFEGPALFAVCWGVGPPQLAVGLASTAVFYSAMFGDLGTARAAALVYSAAFVGAVAVTKHPGALPVWSPSTLSPVVQFAVLGGLVFSMARMIERTEREQERADALRGLGEALSGALDVDAVIAAWLDGVLSLARAAGCTGAVALLQGGEASRVVGARGALEGTLGRELRAADLPRADAGMVELDSERVAALSGALGSAGRIPFAYAFEARAAGERGAALLVVVTSGAAFPEETCAQLTGAAHNAAVALGLARSREAMLRAERLAAIGQLAASMAHELRNPLAAIRGAATYLKRHANADAGAPPVARRSMQFLEIIEREVTSSNRIITELLDFARSRPLMRSATVLRPLVEELRELVPLGDARLVNAVPEELPPHAVDRDQLRQVLANLVQNAVEAAPPERPCEVVVRAAHGGQAPLLLEVEDDGAGMPPEVVARAFEPLFTTKSKGTGLGLAIVGKIVAAHGGTIRVESRPGRGTRIVMELPPERSPVSHPGAARAS